LGVPGGGYQGRKGSLISASLPFDTREAKSGGEAACCFSYMFSGIFENRGRNFGNLPHMSAYLGFFQITQPFNFKSL
jgi:hypothetical protein